MFMIDEKFCKTFEYIADEYDEDGVLCYIVTILMYKVDNCITSKNIFSFKYYFSGYIEFDKLPNSPITVYNSGVVALIRHLKRCANNFKNGSFSNYAIKDSIINYIIEIFKDDPIFKISNIISIDKTFDELESCFKFDKISITYPEDLNTTKVPHVSIEFKYPLDNNNDNTCYIHKISIVDMFFRVIYFDNKRHCISSYIMDTFILPVLDILSSKSDNKIDELVDYLIPHLATDAKTFSFESM